MTGAGADTSTEAGGGPGTDPDVGMRAPGHENETGCDRRTDMMPDTDTTDVGTRVDTEVDTDT